MFAITKIARDVRDTRATATFGLFFAVFELWNALCASTKTPPAILTRLSADLGKIMQMPEVDSKLKALAVKPFHGSLAQLDAFTQASFAKYGKVIRAD